MTAATVSRIQNRMREAQIYAACAGDEVAEAQITRAYARDCRLRRRLCEDALRRGEAIDDGKLTKAVEEAVEI